MNDKTYNIITAILVIGFLGFLFFSVGRWPANTQAQYNLIFYEHIFFNGSEPDLARINTTIPKELLHDSALATGPELYVPAIFAAPFLRLSTYEAAAYISLAFMGAFLAFLLLFVVREAGPRLLAATGFLLLYLSNAAIFKQLLFIHPIGETTACFSLFAGFYLLHKRYAILGLFLLGLALDMKKTFFFALVPTLFVYFIITYVLPELQKDRRKNMAKVAVKTLLMAILFAAPTLLTLYAAPHLLLADNKKGDFAVSRNIQISRITNSGVGQVATFAANPTSSGLSAYTKKATERIVSARSFFNNNHLAFISYVGALTLLLFYARKHFTFFPLLFAAITMFWWMFAATDVRYQSFYATDMILYASVAALLPYLIKTKRKFLAYPILALLVFTAAARFSYPVLAEKFMAINLVGLQKTETIIAHGK